jgi:PD-(D/E)XK nuclease superfamily protein
MQVVAELVRRGFDVLLPVGDSLRYDLVVDLGIAFRRIQVKTARLRNGVLMFGTKSVNYEQGKIVHRHYRDGADDFIAYEPQTRAFYGILVREAAANCVHLRVTPSANHQTAKIRFATNYSLDRLCETWKQQGAAVASRNRGGRSDGDGPLAQLVRAPPR